MATRVLGVVFGAFLLFVSWRVRDAGSLLGSCAAIALVYSLVVSPNYWPWYVALPLALVALSPRGLFLWTALALTLCSRLVAPFADLAVNGFVSWPTALWLISGIGVALPLVLLLLLTPVALWRHRRGRAVEIRG